MEREYHCSISIKNDNANRFFELLEAEGLPVTHLTGEYYVFDVYSYNKCAEEILEYMTYIEKNPIISPIFSKEEMEKANWYSFEATRHALHTFDPSISSEFYCPYQTSLGISHYHRKQIKPFVHKVAPKWKNNYNFCGPWWIDFSLIFCSDLAKKMISNREITGVEYMPVLNKKGIPVENLHQMVFPNILTTSCFDFIQPYEKINCEKCGQLLRYKFKHPNDYNWKIKTELLPPGIDAFRGDTLMSHTWYGAPVIISKKFYNLIAKEMKEKHVRCYPVG